jgi:MFS family permease
LDILNDIPQDILNSVILFCILFGIIQCFSGYRVFKFILVLTGFLTGGILAGFFASTIVQEKIIIILFGFIGGCIGAALMLLLYFVGLFLIGALTGSIMSFTVYTLTETSPQPAGIIIMAVIMGIFALVFQKFMIIISTAFAGAWYIILGVSHFAVEQFDITRLDQLWKTGGDTLYVTAACWLGLSIIGMIVQYRGSRGKKKKNPE